jgi:D-beta-D-heptose 7-phosphate kinase/D-beta-D-heptose 1-phosphate adenosyltransferase
MNNTNTTTSASIIVVGDAMIDAYYYANVKKHAPEAAHVPVHDVFNRDCKLGGACNVALSLHNLGSDVEFVGVVGDDACGRQLETMLRGSNLKHTLFVDSARKTTQKNRVLHNDELACRFDVEDTSDIPAHLQTAILTHIESNANIRVIVISDYSKGVITTDLCQSIIRYANRNGVPTFVDPKVSNWHKYKDCFLFKPNAVESEQITNETAIDRIVSAIHARIECKNVVITLGEHGMIFSEKNDIDNAVTTRAIRHDGLIHKKDVTGAGDVVLSVLVHMYEKSNNVMEACRVANYVAGKSVGVVGNYNVGPSDIDDYYANEHNNANICHAKIMFDYECDKIAELSNRKGVVFTNGCFDILHSAHIKCLKYCKSQGDVLVVGLNDDNSIKKNKGPERPINDVDERATMLSLFDFVDYVIIFSDETPRSVLELLKPCKLIKGGDYAVENIVGAEHANEVLLFDYINNKSTSNVVKKIKNSLQ